MTEKAPPPPQTVVVDWRDRALVFRSDDDELVRVRFPEWLFFQLCCAIAMIQRACSDEDGITRWRGMTQDQFNALADALDWRGDYDGFKPLWSYMASGKSAGTKYRKSRISVDGEEPEDQAGLAQDLFQRVGRGGYAFGKAKELTQGHRLLWKVVFSEPHGDRVYALLRETVSNLLTRGLVGISAATEQELRQAILERNRRTFEHLDVWGMPWPMETLYQEPFVSYARNETNATPQQGESHANSVSPKAPSASGGRTPLTDRNKRYRPIGTVAQLYDALVQSTGTNDRRATHFVVVGEPGSGKSTLLQHLALRSATSDEPVLAARIHLVEWNAANGNLGLEEHLARSFRNVRHAADCAQWRTWLRAGDVLLLLDGLDEIRPTDLVVARLHEALADFDGCPIVLTCRTEVLARYTSLCPKWPVLQLSPLTVEQREQYVHRFHADRERVSRARINALSRSPLSANPLRLATLCFAYDPADERIEFATRSELFDIAVRKLLERERTKVPYGDRPVPATDTKRRVLEHLALDAQTTRQPRIDAGRP